nr:hypothetical protein CFP56_30893 [Quercus suber]
MIVIKALLVVATGFFFAPTTSARHFDVTRFRDNACTTESIDISLVSRPRYSGMAPRFGGMALKRHGECYPYAAPHQRKKGKSVVTYPNGQVDDELFRSISWRWSHTGFWCWQRKKVDLFWSNCTLFVYELPNCDESGRVEARWWVDKWGMQDRCWGFGNWTGARSLMFNCLGA